MIQCSVYYFQISSCITSLANSCCATDINYTFGQNSDRCGTVAVPSNIEGHSLRNTATRYTKRPPGIRTCYNYRPRPAGVAKLDIRYIFQTLECSCPRDGQQAAVSHEQFAALRPGSADYDACPARITGFDRYSVRRGGDANRVLVAGIEPVRINVAGPVCGLCHRRLGQGNAHERGARQEGRADSAFPAQGTLRPSTVCFSCLVRHDATSPIHAKSFNGRANRAHCLKSQMPRPRGQIGVCSVSDRWSEHIGRNVPDCGRDVLPGCNSVMASRLPPTEPKRPLVPHVVKPSPALPLSRAHRTEADPRTACA